jgi:hypothetical protein
MADMVPACGINIYVVMTSQYSASTLAALWLPAAVIA